MHQSMASATTVHMHIRKHAHQSTINPYSHHPTHNLHTHTHIHTHITNTFHICTFANMRINQQSIHTHQSTHNQHTIDTHTHTQVTNAIHLYQCFERKESQHHPRVVLRHTAIHQRPHYRLHRRKHEGEGLAAPRGRGDEHVRVSPQQRIPRLLLVADLGL